MPYATNASDGLRVWYEVEGDGPPVVLLHGTTGSIATFRDPGWVDALGDRYRLLLVDLRGHGRSDAPHDVADYHWDVMAADVVAVLDDAGIAAAHIVGYSTGGLLAFRIAANDPGRALSIAAGGAQPFATTPALQADLAGFIELMRQRPEALVPAIEATTGPLPPGWRADLLNGDLEAFCACAAAEAIDRGLSEEQVCLMTLPALIYAGSEDRGAAGEQARRAVSMMPDARYVELDELDHMTVWARSDLVIPLVAAFLDDVATNEQ